MTASVLVATSRPLARPMIRTTAQNRAGIGVSEPHAPVRGNGELRLRGIRNFSARD
jgi:hypothetical protein